MKPNTTMTLYPFTLLKFLNNNNRQDWSSLSSSSSSSSTTLSALRSCKLLNPAQKRAWTLAVVSYRERWADAATTSADGQRSAWCERDRCGDADLLSRTQTISPPQHNTQFVIILHAVVFVCLRCHLSVVYECLRSQHKHSCSQVSRAHVWSSSSSIVVEAHLVA